MKVELRSAVEMQAKIAQSVAEALAASAKSVEDQKQATDADSRETVKTAEELKRNMEKLKEDFSKRLEDQKTTNNTCKTDTRKLMEAQKKSLKQRWPRLRKWSQPRRRHTRLMLRKCRKRHPSTSEYSIHTKTSLRR